MYVEYYFSAQLTLQHWHSLTDQQVIFLLHIQYMVETYWQMFVLHCCSSLAAFPVFTPLIGQIFHRGLLLPSIVFFFFLHCLSQTAKSCDETTASRCGDPKTTTPHIQALSWSIWVVEQMTYPRNDTLLTPTQPVTNRPITYLHMGSLGWARVKAGQSHHSI